MILGTAACRVIPVPRPAEGGGDVESGGDVYRGGDVYLCGDVYRGGIFIVVGMLIVMGMLRVWRNPRVKKIVRASRRSYIRSGQKYILPQSAWPR
jgi:hypothetical protein